MQRRGAVTAAAVVVVVAGGAGTFLAVRSDDVDRSAGDRSPTPTTVAGDRGETAGGTTTTVRPMIVDHRLFVVGDSVLQGAAPDLVEELDDWELTIDTRVGRFLDEGIRVTQRNRRHLADVAIVGLGNNYGGDAAAFAAEVDRMLDVLAPVDHVLWLTVAEFRDDRHDVNAVLRAAAARDRRVHLVDWNAVWRKDPALTARDRLHLTPAGAARMARLVDDALDRLGLRPTPGAGRPDVRTDGTLPPGSDGAVGDAGDGSRRRTTTTTTSGPSSSASTTTAVGSDGSGGSDSGPTSTTSEPADGGSSTTVSPPTTQSGAGPPAAAPP